MLWGVGEKTALKLRKIKVNTIGDLAKVEPEILLRLFGKIGYDLSLKAKGIDDSHVSPEREIKSISRETTFMRDIDDLNVIIKTLDELTEDVSIRAKEKNKIGRVIKIKIRWGDFSTVTRQKKIASPTNSRKVVFEEAQRLMVNNMERDKKVRLIGVGISDLSNIDDDLQMSFIEEVCYDKGDKLIDNLVNDINEKFGCRVLERGWK